MVFTESNNFQNFTSSVQRRRILSANGGFAVCGGGGGVGGSNETGIVRAGHGATRLSTPRGSTRTRLSLRQATVQRHGEALHRPTSHDSTTSTLSWRRGGPNSLSRPVPAARGGKRKGEPSERGRQAPAPTASQPCRSAAPATDIEAPGNSAHPGPISAADRSCSAQRALTKVGRRSRHQSDRRLLRDLARQCSEANSAANYPPCHPSVNRTTQ